jgi:hypothetical protein
VSGQGNQLTFAAKGMLEDRLSRRPHWLHTLDGNPSALQALGEALEVLGGLTPFVFDNRRGFHDDKSQVGGDHLLDWHGCPKEQDRSAELLG